jgi:hypothetical protein
MRDIAKERRREQAGRDYVDATQQFQQFAIPTVMDAVNQKRSAEMWRQELLGRLRGNVYDDRRQGGILPGLIGAGASLLASRLSTGGIGGRRSGEGS